MRKYLALALVAGLALSSAFGLTGCSKKESTSSTTEQTPTTGGTMGADTTGAGATDTTKHDSM